jgi:hypothetical protein
MALTALGLIVLTAGAWWAFDRSRADRVEFGVTGYQVISSSLVTVSFEVHKDALRGAECRVEAQDRNGAVVGTAVVGVGPGARVPVSHDLATSARATTAIVTACRLRPSPTPGGP